MAISFNQIGQFKGVNGGSDVLYNPTSLQFGPDGRLYVSEQNGEINAFTVTLENGEYIAIAHEELLLPGGSGVVKSIQNHDDDGSLSGQQNRQVTGILVTGTAANPLLYISSSDPRIANNGEKNLDTNSGVLTRVTWTGTEWDAVDLIRGLPRSEENHSNNGMVLSPDGTKLLLTVGGNTNNGAPSSFFSYTGEYALSGTVLEIDLNDLDGRPILTDPAAGQNGTSRKYIYDLPTLDDPSVPNDGVREDQNGMDVAGPWGGNDGFNMAILPSDAPLRIYADGFRNHYDLVLTEAGKLYTVDNGSNGALGGNPIFVNGEATNQPNDGGTGDPEPLFLIEDGGYYGHPVPVRSNQELAWTVYNDSGNPDTSLSVNSIPNLANLVPDAVNIQSGFVIDPTKFTGDPTRLLESGVRIERDSAESNSLLNIGSSSNGLVEYTGDAFNGELKGDLLVAQFNGSVARLNLNADGTAATYETISGLGSFSTPLDVTMGPDGTVWVAEIGGDFIKAFAPSDLVLPDDPDFDNDGIFNIDDPFIRDADNGTSVVVFPGQTLLWDFDANQDDNLPGPDGYGGGLTGVMIDGSTDFEQFFQEASTLEGQNIKLDNVKFITAAGGGTTVVENVSNGDALTTSNNGEYLFHTGVTMAPTVETFTVKWSIYNPTTALIGPDQQIGGYIGTGDQSNYLKIVAIEGSDGEIQAVLEDGDVVQSSSFIQADDLFSVPDGSKIFIELEVDPIAETATPTITYEIDSNKNTNTVSGDPINLSGTAVLDAIKGNYTVLGQQTGIAVGLYSSNTGQLEADTFQAIFDDIEVTATGDNSAIPLYRVNAGGSEVAALDGGPNWLADTATNNSLYLADPGSNNTGSFTAVEPGAAVPPEIPGVIFDTERWDGSGGSKMQWEFNVTPYALYGVNLFMGNGFGGTSATGQRVFDVALEGNVTDTFDDIDLSALFGHEVGGMLSDTVYVTDGILNIDFLHQAENPLVNGIEIVQIGLSTPTVSIEAVQNGAEPSTNGQFTVSISETASTDTVVSYTVTGSATEYSDYTVLTKSVTIPAGELSAFINIEVNDDQVLEGQENVTITLDSITSGDSDVVIGTTNSATVNIEDNEIANEVNFSTVQNAAEPDTNGQFNVSLTEAAATDTVVTYTVSGTATPNTDYTALTGSVTIAAGQLSAPIDVTVLDDLEIEGQESVIITLDSITAGDSNVILGATDTATVNISDDEAFGAAVFSINLNSNNVQTSNFGTNSFEITNTGYKKIAKLEVDVTNALYPDTVFDPFGLAGDTAAKQLGIDTNGNTGVVSPDSSTYIGAGGIAGFEKIQLFFDENVNGGFDPGETLGFSVDMDPNSIAGSDKSILDAGSDPNWDVGGVSGAELIGSTVTVTFTDGSTATGQLQGAGNQAGSQTLASQDLANQPVSLTVNGLGVGGVGTYNADGPSVIINGTAGQTARIVLSKGFIQPATNEFFNSSDPDDQEYALQLQAQLDALAASDFPANNAVEFQTVDVLLTGEDQDISSLFDFSGVDNYNFAGEEQLALGFVASAIDPSNNNLPIGPVTQPIYLEFDAPPEVSIAAIQNATEPDLNGQFAVSITEAATTDTIISYTVTGTATADGDYTALTGSVTIPAGQLSAAIDVPVIDDLDVESTESVIVTLDAITSGDSDVVLGSNNTATVSITDNEVANEVSISTVQNAAEPDVNGQFSVSLTEAAATDTVVNYTVAGTATADADYTALSGSVTIAAGQLSASIDVTVIDDSETEVQEDLVVTLDAVTGDNDLILGATNSASLTITDDDATAGSVLYRVNAGGAEIAAIDGGPNWLADTATTNSLYLVDPGSNNTASFSGVEPGANVLSSTPGAIFDTERWDGGGGTEMQWAFDVADGLYEVRLYMGNGYSGTSSPGARVFDVALEGNVLASLDDIDLSAQFGHEVGGMISNTVSVSDGILNVDFLHQVENPLINGLEIVQV